MALHIQRLSFEGFRGYSTFTLDDLQHLVVLVGHNAVGKTNIIEGIQLLTSGESFRRPSWPQVISWGRDACAISAVITDGKRVIDHRMKVTDGKRSYEVNGKKKAANAIKGTYPAVLFIPDHLLMVKESSAARRDAVDSLATQLSKNYNTLRTDYAQSLKQRNLLIKEEIHSGPLFESWDESCSINGARLTVNRIKLFNRLLAHMREIYPNLVDGEELDAVYVPSWARFDETGRQSYDIATIEEARTAAGECSALSVEEVTDKLIEGSNRLAYQEVQRKTSLIGPHKDDISLFINGKNARMFASQGQQRTVVLAWKLAEVELVREFTGQDPVLLLDDVMSELDGRRRDALTSFIERSAQTFITTTNLGYFSQELLEQAQVIQLPIEGTKI